MYKGQVLDKQVKLYVAKDPHLMNRGIQITKQGVKGPDFINPNPLPHESNWYDLTTQAAWPAHQAKYTATYGQGTGIFWK